MSGECTHWCGHKFEARYDLSPPTVKSMQMDRAYPFQAQALMEASKAKTYVRDVCVRCGRTIERQKEASA